MRGSKGVEIKRLATHGAYLLVAVALLLVVGGCGKQLTRMEENQVKLQAMVAANARELATLSSQIHTGQGKLEAGIQDLDGDGQEIATQVQTVREDQRKLQQTVVAGNQAIEAKATQLQEGQQSLHGRVAQVGEVAAQTASDLTALSRQHNALHEKVQANQRELNGRMGAVVSNQESIQAGITRLQQMDAGLAQDIASAAGKQDAFAAQVQDNHRQVAECLTTLAAGQERFTNDLLTVRDDLQHRTQAVADKLNILELHQQNHQAGIDRLFATANQMASTISTMAAAQTAMQESLNGNHEQTVNRLVSLVESQQSLQAGINALNGKADQAATDSAAATSALRAGQTAAREATKANHDAIITAMAGLSDGQRSLSNEVHALTATSGQTALAVLTMNNGQATFQQAMQTGMSGLHDRADQTADDVRGMAGQQTSFQAGIKASNEALVSRTAAIEDGQRALATQIDRTTKVIDRAYADLTGVSVAQDTLESSFSQHSDMVNNRMARIEDSQKSLGDGQDILMSMTGQATMDILALSNGHADLQRSIRTGNEAILGQAAALDESQKTLAAQLDILTATAGQTAIDVLAIENDQVAMAQSIRTGLADLSERTDHVATNQQQMQSGLDTLTTTAGQTATDVTAVAGRQDSLQKAIQSYSESTNGQMAQLAENQQKIQTGVDAIATTTGQTASDVTAVAGRQAALQQAIQSHGESTNGQMAQLAENQQKIQTGVDGIAATTGQTASDVTAVAGRQDSLQKAIQSYSESTTGQMAQLAENQQKMQTGVDGIAATTGQTASDVTAVAGRQDSLQKAIHSFSESTTGQMTQLVEGQQKMQSGLDAVTATTGQTAHDVVVLTASQAESEQAAQTGRTQVIAKLEAMAQDRQGWIERLDATQARMQAMAESIASLDQQIGKLQGAVQTGLQGANNPQHGQFEAKIADDVKAMIDAISQLRLMQSQLQEQMSQMQKATLSQTETLKTTIEQIRQPLAEVKVSGETSTASPVVVETGK